MAPAAPRLLLLDNFDSFTFILADTLLVAGAEVVVARNNALGVEAALAGRDGIVISPGPGRPEDAGVSIALAAACLDRDMPLLGVCLGHQTLGLACGAAVARVAPVHGKIEPVRHDGSGLFSGMPSPLEATRYHSLAVTDLPPSLHANAWSADGTIMAVRHDHGRAHGIQFHPESIGTALGGALVAAFVEQCRQRA